MGGEPDSRIDVSGFCLVDGLFHADPHPGNLFVVDEPGAAEHPRLLFVDFGLSRRLDPELNIWTLAEPLIEAWMIENRGPEARARGAIQDLGQTLERLPRLAAEAERLATDLASGGLRLHPDSLKAMAGGDANRSARWAFWIALAALAVALLAV